MNTKSLRVFKLTDSQMSMVIDSIMFAYEMDIEERNDYDLTDYQAMLDEVVSPYED